MHKGVPQMELNARWEAPRTEWSRVWTCPQRIRPRFCRVCWAA